MKANKNAINNGQSRDTGNIAHKIANKNAINNGQSRDRQHCAQESEQECNQ